MFRTGTPNNGAVRWIHAFNTITVLVRLCCLLFHLLRNLLVDSITEVFYGALSAAEHDGSIVVWRQTTRLGIYSHEVEGLPHLLDQLINIHPLSRGDGHAHWDLVPVLVQPNVGKVRRVCSQ